MTCNVSASKKCADCATDILQTDDRIACLLCDNFTHMSCCRRYGNDSVPIKLVAATPNFYHVCSNCNHLVASKNKRKIFRRQIGSALQEKATHETPPKKSNVTEPSAASNKHDTAGPSTAIHQDSQISELKYKLNEIQQSVCNLIDEQRRFQETINDLLNGPSSNESFHTASTNSRSSDNDYLEYLQSTITFTPMGRPSSPTIAEPRDISLLPSISSSNINGYVMNTIAKPINDDDSIRYHEDYDKYTAPIKIIGVPTNNPRHFGELLISKNRWLHLKYLHVNLIYQTESSYKKSFNYIVTLDTEAHRQCTENAGLCLGRGWCKVFDNRATTHCTRCQALDHNTGTAKTRWSVNCAPNRITIPCVQLIRNITYVSIAYEQIQKVIRSQ